MAINMSIYAIPKAAACMMERISCCTGVALNVTTCGPGAGSSEQHELSALEARACAARYCWNCRNMKPSYSLPRRRRNSRQMTRRKTPMHEAANVPSFSILHDSARKPVSYC